MTRNLVIGDIHGMYDRMISALSSSGFNPEEDNLYAVGDFCDRGPDPIRVLDHLMSLPHFFPVVGNHDMWLYEYLCGHGPAPIWLDPRNGGRVTYEIFRDLDSAKKKAIMEWYGSFPFLRTAGDKMVLHAGPPHGIADGESLVRLMDTMTLASAFRARQLTGSYIPHVHGIVWDRDYIRSAIGWENCPEPETAAELSREPLETGRTIICGHTPLKTVFHSDRYHITCIDTGSFAPEGQITVMDMDSGELFSVG